MKAKKIAISFSLFICLFLDYFTFSMEQEDNEKKRKIFIEENHNKKRKVLLERQESNKYQEIFNANSLKDIAVGWITNNITINRSLLKKIYQGKLVEESKELIRQKLLKKYQFELCKLFGIKSCILRGHSDPIESVAFSPCGKFALTGSWDKTIRLWDLSDLTNITALVLNGHVSEITSVAFSPCGNFVLTGSEDFTARLWDLRDLNNITPIALQGHNAEITSVAFSPCGKFILTGSEDFTVRLWNWDVKDLKSVKCILRFFGHTRFVTSVAFSPCGKFVLTGSLDNTSVFWDLREKNFSSIVLEDHTDGVHSVKFSPCGNFILTGSEDFTARLWDIRDLSDITSIVLNPHTYYPITSVEFSPCGRFALTGSYCTICFWDLRDLNNLTSIVVKDHTNLVTAVAFSPCGRFALTGSYDKTARLWFLEPNFTLEQLILLAILFENKCEISVLNKDPYKVIYDTFTEEEKDKIQNFMHQTKEIEI